MIQFCKSRHKLWWHPRYANTLAFTIFHRFISKWMPSTKNNDKCFSIHLLGQEVAKKKNNFSLSSSHRKQNPTLFHWLLVIFAAHYMDTSWWVHHPLYSSNQKGVPPRQVLGGQSFKGSYFYGYLKTLTKLYAWRFKGGLVTGLLKNPGH